MARGSESIVILGISLRFWNLGLLGRVMFSRVSKDLLAVRPKYVAMSLFLVGLDVSTKVM